MKKLLLGLALVVLSGFSLQAGNVLVTNYNEDTGAQRPISTFGGTPLLTGGSVGIGSFTSADPSSLIANAGTPAGWAALLADFIFFGAQNAVGADLPGLYQVDKSQSVPPGSSLVDKNIYTLIGNAATLAASGESAIVRHAAQFGVDAPTFSRVADISLAGNEVLRGTLDGPSVTTALGSAASLRLAPIPEPMSLTLLLSGLALVFRRRRA
jgi:hypothetical protein